MQYYAGIGSRRTPLDVQEEMRMVAEFLGVELGYTLRSGGAAGADKAFEEGAKRRMRNSQIFTTAHKGTVANKSVEWFHPAPNALRSYGRELMARNLYQITGFEVEEHPIEEIHDLLVYPKHLLSKFVVCWTADGCNDGRRTTINTGGTGQAIRIAEYLDIPVYNLKNDEDVDELIDNWLPGWPGN